MGSHASSDSADENTPLSAADMREIDRLLRLLQAQRPSEREQLIEHARLVITERRRRAKVLGKSMFGEPAWEMLLHLYVADAMSLTIGKLVDLLGEPRTTVLRWLAYLEEKRLVGRRDDPDDRRVVWIGLLERGQELLDEYFSAFASEGH